MQFVLDRPMIQITPHMRILVEVQPIDFRAGIDALVARADNAWRPIRLEAPCSSLAIARTGIKILVYDGQGFWLYHKRLSSGRLTFWPDGDTPTRTLQACELHVLLLGGGDPTRANAAPAWRRLSLTA